MFYLTISQRDHTARLFHLTTSNTLFLFLFNKTHTDTPYNNNNNNNYFCLISETELAACFSGQKRIHTVLVAS